MGPQTNYSKLRKKNGWEREVIMLPGIMKFVECVIFYRKCMLKHCIQSMPVYAKRDWELMTEFGKRRLDWKRRTTSASFITR